MNTNESDLELIRRCRDGEASAEELALLEKQLREDGAFRDAYVRYVNLDVALETASALETAPAFTRFPSPVGPGMSRSSWRPLKAAAAGLAVGVFSASVAWAVALPWLAEARLAIQMVFSESFESSVAATLPGLPRDCGVWWGDQATVVPAEQGLKPKSGGKMLRFVSATHSGESSPRSQWGDVYRLVDVRGLAGESRTMVRLSASFAEAPVGEGEQYACSVEAIALDLDRDSLPAPLLLPWVRENGSSSSWRTFPMVGHCQWQEVSVEVPISPKTQFVLLHLAVTRKSPAIKSGSVHFSGHYLDDVKLELVSGP